MLILDDEDLQATQPLDASARQQLDALRQHDTLLCVYCAHPGRPGRSCSRCGRDPLLDRRYALLHVLSRGADGVLFAARDLETDRVVAIKELTLPRIGTLDAIARFESQIHALRSLDHRGIPAYLGTAELLDGPRSALYLIQELIEGQDISHRAASLDEGGVIAFLSDIAEIVAYLHSLHPPMVHGNIRPDHVMRRPDGSPVLIDFAASLEQRRDDALDIQGSDEAFAAPELDYDNASTASDIYSVGALALWLHNGRTPEPHDPLAWTAHVQLSAPTRDLLEVMLSPDPRMRLNDGPTLVTRLAQIRDFRARANQDVAPSAHRLPVHVPHNPPGRDKSPALEALAQVDEHDQSFILSLIQLAVALIILAAFAVLVCF